MYSLKLKKKKERYQKEIERLNCERICKKGK